VVARFVPNPKAQDYLHGKYGLPRVTMHTQRLWIKAGKFPRPIKISQANQVYTEEQLDEYAASLLGRAATPEATPETSPAADAAAPSARRRKFQPFPENRNPA
jgi:predicted DNA-binding transcriptional regulator AlpA